MRKIREVLRLDSLGLSQRQIALSCCVGQATVSNYLKAAEHAGLKWADIAGWGEERLVEALAPAGAAAPRREHKANEKLFVDYAGPTISVHDPAMAQVRVFD